MGGELEVNKIKILFTLEGGPSDRVSGASEL